MARKACKMGGRGCSTFRRYLVGTLIPDTDETGRDGMVRDLEALVAFLDGAKSVSILGRRTSKAAWMNYVANTLIPDLEEGESAYADDFEEGLALLKAR